MAKAIGPKPGVPSHPTFQAIFSNSPSSLTLSSSLPGPWMLLKALTLHFPGPPALASDFSSPLAVESSLILQDPVHMSSLSRLPRCLHRWPCLRAFAPAFAENTVPSHLCIAGPFLLCRSEPRVHFLNESSLNTLPKVANPHYSLSHLYVVFFIALVTMWNYSLIISLLPRD